MRNIGRLGLAFAQALCVAAVLGAATLSPPALADNGNGNGSPGLPPGVRGPAMYGQVVDVGSHAVVVQLSNSDWVALNITPQTVIVSPPGSAPGLGGIVANDWVLATFVDSGRNGGFAARWLTFSPTPVSIGHAVHVTGTVTALLSGGSFSMSAGDGAQWIVTLDPQTLVRLGNVVSTLSFLQTGDMVQVWGTAAGQTITASRIVYRVTGQHDNAPKHHGR